MRCGQLAEYNMRNINLSSLVNQFFHMTKKVGQIFKYLRNEKSFQYDIKSFFIIF